MLRMTKCAAISLSITLLSACALAPGMRVGDLPPSGKLLLANGLNVQVDQITTNALPVSSDQTISSDTRSLFNHNPYPIYLLASGDILSINLWANPEITPPAASGNAALASGFTIDQSGYISFPMIGRIKAQGESLESFTSLLQKRLAVYLKQPDAQVRVLVYAGHKFNIDGAVKMPGQYPMSEQPTSMYAALTNAGGALESGDINNIVLTRDGKSYQLRLLELEHSKLSLNSLFLKDGDSVHVYSKENRKIYLLGEAGAPTPFIIPEQGMSLANLVGEGRGLSPVSANPAMVYVVRDDAGQNLTHIYHVDLSSLANMALASRFTMRPNDIVYVDASGLARWSRVLNLLLPSAQGLASLSTAGYYGKQ